jgi:hypothetical protein
MQGRHSIAYTSLEAWLYVFAIWNERNECLAWDETEEWATLLGLKMVPVLYRGESDSIPYSHFRECAAKYVRRGHVRTSTHWMHGEMVENQMRDGRSW